MKALILVGGYGTRLRPFTFSKPKPCVPFCNKAILAHQVEALIKVGVTEVVLAVNYKPEDLTALMADFEKQHKVKITYSLEDTPMGTAGPLGLARKILADGDPFFVLNSDVTCEYPFEEMLAFHKSTGAEGTIFVTPVEDPSKYGVVVSKADGQIERFVEKPKTFVGNMINAGMYILNTEVLDRIEDRPMSIEREVFPKIASDGRLFALPLKGFWMDIGQPKDFILGTQFYLAALRRDNPEALASGKNVFGNCLVHPTASVHADALIGPDVVIGPNCVVAAGARVRNSTLMEGAKIGSHSWVDTTMMGWGSSVGRWVRCEGLTCLGEDTHLKDEIVVDQLRVLPHKAVGASQKEQGTIVM
eukprot:GCRY01004547.1.p1 GENE.GCRY01004547.1~~GCRY01004547.1.p1  ORF type:complete len:369 (+),score=75.33 GCRY01004547.1:30-1109(+)